jgi:hypothetical protein
MEGAPLVSLENVVTSLQLLLSLDASILSQGITGMAVEGQLAGGSTLGDKFVGGDCSPFIRR